MPIPHDEAHKWVGPGWHELVKKLVADLEAINPDFNIEQVKEKFGGLRFYGYATGTDSYGWTDEQEKLVSQAEEASFTICEMCGEPGTPNDDGFYWVKTNCVKHRAERIKAIAGPPSGSQGGLRTPTQRPRLLEQPSQDSVVL